MARIRDRLLPRGWNRWIDGAQVDVLLVTAARYEESGHVTDARWALDKAAATILRMNGSDDPRVPGIFLRLAARELQDGLPGHAARTLAVLRKDFLEQAPEFRDAVFQLSILTEVARDDFDAAEGLSREALRRPAGDRLRLLAGLTLAKIETGRGQLGEAFRLLSELPATDATPDDMATLLSIDAAATLAQAFGRAGQHGLGADLIDDVLTELDALPDPGPPYPIGDVRASILLSAARLHLAAEREDRDDRVSSLLGRADAEVVRPSELADQVDHLRALHGAVRVADDLGEIRRLLDAPPPTTDPRGGPVQRWIEAQVYLLPREYEAGETEAARVRAERALPLTEAAFGPDHHRVGTLLDVLAAVGDRDGVPGNAFRAATISTTGILRAAPLCSPDELSTLVDRHFRQLHRLITACLNADAGEALFDIVVQRHGLEYEITGRVEGDRLHALTVGGEQAADGEIAQLLTARRLAAARREPAVTFPRVAEVRAALPPGGALLHIVVWQPADLRTGLPHGEPEYLGLFLTADRLQILRFGEVTTVDRRVADFLHGEKDTTALRELLDLRTAVDDTVGHLLIVPDGLLGLIPWEQLPAGVPLTYLTNVRRLTDPPPRGEPAEPLVIAAEDYGPAVANAFPGYFPPLPDAEREAAEVARILGVEPRLGAAATRELLLSARSPRVLHLAVHGFHLADYDPDVRRATGTVESRLMWAVLPFPLLRCGLALPGANDDPGRGLVTGEDIAALPLAGTELVVLAACDSARGDLRVQEGTTGLARAFTTAGARAVLVSLWAVHDHVGRRLMTAFYTRYEQTRDPVGALRHAQQTVAARYPDPTHWAGFVLYNHVPADAERIRQADTTIDSAAGQDNEIYD